MTTNKIVYLKDLALVLIKRLDTYKLNESWIDDQDHELSLDRLNDDDYDQGIANLTTLIENRKKMEHQIAKLIENLNFVYNN